MKRLHLTALVAFIVALLPQSADAGAFVTVNQDEPDRVAHRNYFGTGGELAPILVCIDNSVNPTLAAAAEPAVRNVVATYNRFRSLPDNTYADGAATSAPVDQVDFETVLLHEFMHANGLDHPNQANNPGGTGGYLYNDSRSSGGANGVLDRLGDVDGIPGSADDQRGDDVNLLWYPRGSNDPAVQPAVVDTTTMARTLGFLPAGQQFAANANVEVMAALGHANSEGVAVQGYLAGRVARHLHHDDLTMLRLARAGIDGIAGTADDYRAAAVFAGFYNNPQGGECSTVVRFVDEVSFASTFIGLTPLAPNHWRLIYPTRMRFNPGVNWYFTPGANTTVQVNAGGISSGLTPYSVQATVGKAAYNLMSGSPRGTVVVRDGPRDHPQTATCSIELTPSSNGVGSCMLTPLTAGSKTLTADFLGWGGWDGNTGTGTHVSSGTVVFSNVTHTPSPSGVNVDVTFDWTLAPPVNGAPVQPTGNVVVKEAASCAAEPVEPAHQCTATLPAHACAIRFASGGTKTVQLCYAGDDAVAPANTSVTHSVAAGRPTTTSIVSHTPSQTAPFAPYTVQVQVRETPDAGGHPQGQVIVRDGDVSNPLTTYCTATLAGTPNETASCQLASSRAGNHQLVASFAEQGTWTGSNSTPIAHPVRSFAIVANVPASVPLGHAASVTVALDVAPFGGTPQPTGTIVVGDGVDTCEIVLPAMQCPWRGSSIGTRQLTATWSGDANYPAMTATAVTQTVTAAQLPVWVSQARSGYPESNAASASSSQALSADGRYLVFSSSASDLVGGDTNNVEDVFVRDQMSGALRLVSATADGIPGNGASRYPSISANGRYVSFQSEASNFFTGDGADKDIFVKDLHTGAIVRATTRADGSAPTTPEIASAITQLRSSLSADGRLVAFPTYRALSPGDNNGQVDIYVKNLDTGALDLVSSNSADQSADSSSLFPSLSGDGRYVAFISPGNFVPGVPGTTASNRVYRKDRVTRATALVSAAADGTPANGACVYPSINANGRYVALQCSSNNLPVNGYSGDRVFVKDMDTGAIELGAPGSAYSVSMTPSISADGRYVAFQVGIGSPSGLAVFVRDRQNGTMTNQHVTPAGTAVPESSTTWEPRMWPSISGDGRYVSFASASSALVPPDNNGAADVFVRDRALGVTQRASGAHAGPRNDGDSDNAAISRDGSLVLFDSWSTRIVDGDTNATSDVFAQRTDTGVTTRISTAANGTPGNGASYAPALASSTGDVYFLSAANNLVSGDTNGKVDVFRKRLSDGSIERVNLFYTTQATADAQAPIAVGADAPYIAFASPDTGISGDRNGYTDIVVYTRNGSGGAQPVVGGANGNSMQPSVSDDSRILAFASDATNLGVGGNAVRNVFARNMREYYNVPQPLQLVSANAAGTAADGNSEQPAVSADGRYVAFVSWATNLVPGDDNGVADIFVKNIETGAIERVNTNAAGSQGTGGDCASPSFSAGARYVGFVCAQANLVAGGGTLPAFYVKDRTTGAIVRLSQTDTGVAADALSSAGSRALGDNGMAVFTSDAGNLASIGSSLVSNVFMGPYPGTFDATTVTIVSTSPETPEAGRGYTVNITVAGTGANPPSGRVRVFDGTNAYPTCVATLTPGTPSTGSCGLATGVSGNATLTAYYGGDDTNGAAKSAPYPLAVQHRVTPIKPNIISAVPGSNRVTLNIGLSNVGSPFTAYIATCGTYTATSTSMPITVTGMPNGTPASCTIVVRNTIGDSPASDPATATPIGATTTSIVSHTPNPSQVNTPYTVNVSVLGDGTPTPGGQLMVSDGGAGTCVATLTAGSPSVGSCTMNSTQIGNRTLTATYPGDTANSGSSGSVAHTVAGAPNAPVLTQATRGNGQATLTFNAADSNGSAVLDYTATCGSKSTTGTASPLAITGLTNGTEVTCTVVARNAFGTGAASNALAVTPATTPDKPTIVSVQPGDGSATVTFTPPASDGGSAIDTYRVICSNKIAVGAASPLVVTGLTNGVSVNCLMLAHNAVGNSQLTSPVAVTPAAAPGAPVLSAVAPGDARVTLVFDAPVSNGGSAVLDFTATCGSQSVTGAASPLTVTGLANDVEVSCSVTARNAASSSAASNMLTATPVPSRVHTALALTTGGEPSTWGQSLTFTATVEPVAPASATPTGTVTFKDGGTPIAGCIDIALTTTTPIVAACTTSTLSVGDHTVTAAYGGDATYTAGQQPVSTVLSHTVNRATGTADFGELQFVYDGNVKTLTAQLHEEPTATCSVTPSSIGPNAGSTQVTASCEGTTHIASGSATATIAKAMTTLTLTSDCMRTFVEGQPYTLVATLTGGVNATGSVDFGEGTNTLCGGVAVQNGAATCVTTPLSAGQQPVATLALGAGYGGDANHAASQGSPIEVTVLALVEAIFRNGYEAAGDPDACPIE